MLKEVYRLLPIVTLIWLLLFILAGVSGVYLNQPFDFVSPFVVGALWLWGALLVLGLVASLFEPDGRTRRITCLLLTLIVLPVFYVYGDEISFYSYFYWHKSQYEEVIARVNSSTECPPQKPENQKWTVDCGSPRRVAFSMPGGIIDNWIGIVYDPTGLVMQANQVPMADLKNPKYAYVVGLFGGDMTYARHLFGPWYLCSFT